MLICVSRLENVFSIKHAACSISFFSISNSFLQGTASHWVYVWSSGYSWYSGSAPSTDWLTTCEVHERDQRLERWISSSCRSQTCYLLSVVVRARQTMYFVCLCVCMCICVWVLKELVVRLRISSTLNMMFIHCFNSLKISWFPFLGRKFPIIYA